MIDNIQINGEIFHLKCDVLQDVADCHIDEVGLQGAQGTIKLIDKDGRVFSAIIEVKSTWFDNGDNSKNDS